LLSSREGRSSEDLQTRCLPNEFRGTADNSARWWRFLDCVQRSRLRNLMAGVLPVTSGHETPSTPGPAEQSSRDRARTFAGDLPSSNGGVALVVAPQAPRPRGRLRRRRVRRHAHRLATALCLSTRRTQNAPAGYLASRQPSNDPRFHCSSCVRHIHCAWAATRNRPETGQFRGGDSEREGQPVGTTTQSLCRSKSRASGTGQFRGMRTFGGFGGRRKVRKCNRCQTCRGGGTGRRTGLKILGPARGVWVQDPPPAPKRSNSPLPDGDCARC
jgi:hypothetical protein